MFQQILKNQFPKEVNGFIINFPKEVKGFNIDELNEYCENKLLNKENFTFTEDKVYYSIVFLFYVMLILSNKSTSENVKKNKDFLIDMLEKSSIFDNDTVSKSFENSMKRKKSEIIDHVKELNEEEKKSVMKFLIQDSIFDKQSITYQLYINPLNFLKNILPQLEEHYNKYYNILKEEENLENVLDRTITKEQVDILVSKDLSNIIEFSALYFMGV